MLLNKYWYLAKLTIRNSATGAAELWFFSILVLNKKGPPPPQKKKKKKKKKKTTKRKTKKKKKKKKNKSVSSPTDVTKNKKGGLLSDQFLHEENKYLERAFLNVLHIDVL